MDRHAPLRFAPMDEAAARDIIAWRYEAPYDVYNLGLEDEEQVVSCFPDPANAYYAIFGRQRTLAAYCCFGAEGQVPGGDYSDSALDMGLGVRPDLTGQGLGGTFVGAILRFAQGELAPAAFRVTVAEFNERALRVWKRAGFQPAQRFKRTFDGMPFVVLTRRANGAAAEG
ncbi:MAG: GNAT family N-acetyltransferase [Anaerolineales bacterium]